ncbi:MAG: TlpA family protein disulfide reductase [Solirubrobacterales bacterium]|nr:TlpA family protein disulfide reductase [Solirubrobacterales bacterium]
MAVHRRLAVLALLIVALSGLVLAGCGKSDEPPSPAPDYAKKLAGAPAPLASLYDQGNELLPGGLDAYNAQIASLKGFPAVVNVWASWCGPCRVEFPFFQQLSAKMGKRVAFLGVNSDDGEGNAKDLLSDFPVPYPSFSDSDRHIADDIGARYFPATAFYDSQGQLTYTHVGQYPDQESLEEAIQQYAIEGQTG